MAVDIKRSLFGVAIVLVARLSILSGVLHGRMRDPVRKFLQDFVPAAKKYLRDPSMK